MKKQYIDKKINYDGSQLRSLFAYLNFGVLGHSIVSWQGPCDVGFAHMLDGEDLLQKSAIRADCMLHFIIEIFDASLLTAVALQRLFASIVADNLRNKLAPGVAAQIRREGDDIFFSDKKFSISIATCSPVSALIHFAVNVGNEGTPVPTSALSDFGLKPVEFAGELMNKFSEEFQSIVIATQKVRPTTSF